MELSSIHDSVRSINETRLEGHLCELFYQKLRVQLGESVFFEITKEESTEIIHALNVFDSLIFI